MKKALFVSVLLMPLFTGCTDYARIEQLYLGMSMEQARQIAPNCTFRGEAENTIEYTCDLSVPRGYESPNRIVKPYILVFRNERLYEITLDEKELDRRALPDRVYYPPSPSFYYYHYRH